MERYHGFFVVFGLLLVGYLNKSSAFNLDLNFVDIIEVGDVDSYFGYSILLQKGGISSVIVGAPKSNSSHQNHIHIKNPGALYKCDIGKSNNCRQYIVDQEGNTEFRGGDSRYNYKNKKDGGLLGASVDGGENIGDPVFVCSPRWINDRTDRNGQHFLPNGICYGLRDSRYLNTDGEKIMPLLNSGKQGFTLNFATKYYYAMGEVGMSMQYLRNEKELLLGAPGVLSWEGTVVRYKDLNSPNIPQQQRLQQFPVKRQANTLVNVPNPVHITSLKEDNSYFGYAISSGVFETRNRRLWYVAGAPRAEDLYGMVLLYEFPTYDDSDLIVHRKLVGDQLGAYFGAALLSVDITGNGVADLLVGAPTYFTETYDEGCVYFYKNNGKGNFENPLKLFGNKHKGARFGTTISSIGDINQDSYQDVAISAPYEEQGVVYIYLGNKNGLSTEFTQRIAAKDIASSLRGFGFSISKGVDIDRNFYNDIAIGAYKSGQVAIIKSRPVIKYFTQLRSSLRELSVDTTKFTIDYCIKYETSNNTVRSADTFVKITKDSRAINSNDITQNLTLIRGQDFCSKLEIMLKSGNFDYTKPFTVEMSYAVAESTLPTFCASCPITNPTDSKSVILNIPFANGCGDDHICQPNLKIAANFDDNMSSLTIGLLTTIRLKIHIENNGEPAYLCQMHMVLPSDVEIVRIPSKCQFSNDRIYHCLVDNALQPNAHRDFVFDLDVKKLNPKDKQLFFNLTVDSKGQEINAEDNSFLINLPLRLENNIEIGGKSFPDQIVYVDEENKIKSEQIKFDHKFSIKNTGPSPLPQATIRFYLPVELDDDKLTNKVAFDVYKPEVLVNNQLIDCTTDYHQGFHTENVTGEESGIDENDSKSIIRRLKRNTNSENVTSDEQFEELGSPEMLFDLPINRTVFVNCSTPGIKCMQVTCVSDETINRNQYIHANFHINAHIDVLKQILDNKDIILLTSTAETDVNGNITQNTVPTILIGSLTKEEVSYWIYIVCIIAAVVILAILVFVLYKVNFFNRPMREKLQEVSEGSSEKNELDYEHPNSLYNT